jgi:hypothetical protein
MAYYPRYLRCLRLLAFKQRYLYTALEEKQLIKMKRETGENPVLPPQR